MARTTRYVRVELDVTLDTPRTPAQIAAAVANLQARLTGIAGVTVGTAVVTAFAPDDGGGWTGQ